MHPYIFFAVEAWGYGGHRGGFSNGDEEHPRRALERHILRLCINDFKREGSVVEIRELLMMKLLEKFPREEDNTKVNSENPETEEEKQPKDKARKRGVKASPVSAKKKEKKL
ncbi:hypothetical protein C5167_039613 [Papaver somniferum]|uniref:Uncharacterized protein n=1 Tax=Papaver somniferum TaxID=3469 RepID=A0A4Y7IF31_PAPSO|nr:hypothetical protein C5167_039613 [Papaver somniferum]